MVDWVFVLLLLELIPIQFIIIFYKRSIEINKDAEQYFEKYHERISKNYNRMRNQCWRNFVGLIKKSSELANKKVTLRDETTGNEIYMDLIQSNGMTPKEEKALMDKYGPQYDKMAKEIDEINKPYALNFKIKNLSSEYANIILWFSLIIGILTIVIILLFISLFSYYSFFIAGLMMGILEFLILVIILFFIKGREDDKTIIELKKELEKMLFEYETGIPIDELPEINI